MTRFQRLEMAEILVEEQGNTTMFYRTYSDARQEYDIDTAIHMALEQQNLLSKYNELVAA